jgi:hypothetical protein
MIERFVVGDIQFDMKLSYFELLELERTCTSGLGLEAAADTEVFALVVAFQVENDVE